MTAGNYLVIGGSSGIGHEIVKGLAIRKDQVWVGARNVEALSNLDDITVFQYDVAHDAFPAIDLPDTLQGMVYCPGTIRLRPFNRLKESDFLEDWQINLMGAVRTLQACWLRLKKSPQGASIILFSTVAVKTGMPFHSSIASAKGAIEGLTRSLAAELAPRIRVNAIAPSLTDTPLAATLLSNDDKRQAAGERHPLKRIGSPQEIAQLALFLLSDSSSWITGQVLAVDGGMSALQLFR